MAVENAKISVILPVYNVEKYLKQSLNCLLNQTLTDLEIICVDDCSTDKSLEILEKYAKKDNRFVILKNDSNHGAGYSRNRAIDIAKGNYLMFLDPDDWLENNACELCYNQISQNNNDIVLFSYNKYYEETDIYKPQTKTIDVYKKYFGTPNIDLNTVNKNFIVSCYTGMMICKRDFINKYNIRYNNCYNFEDHVFYIKAVIHSSTISVINKALYNYRVRKNSTTYSYNNQAEDLYSSRKQIFDEIEKYNIEGNKKKAVYINTIKTCVFWYKRYSKMFPKLEKHLYENIRKIFLSMDSSYIEEEIKNKISEELYAIFIEIKTKTYIQHKLSTLPQKLRSFVYSVSDANDAKHSIINILGFKFKWMKSLSYIDMDMFYNATEFLFPEDEEKEKYLKLCSQIQERKKIYIAQKNYKKIIKRIQKQHDKLKVIFLVNNINNWKLQSLYDYMAKSEKFEPVIAATILGDITKRKPKDAEKVEEIYNYFLGKGMNVIYGINDFKYTDINELKPDIVFYEKPYAEEEIIHPRNIAKQALICYIPANINSYEIQKSDCEKIFHKYLYKHYLANKDLEYLYRKFSQRNNFSGIGHPILDYIYINKDKTPEHNYVIYAPHNSINHSANGNNYGTFLKNGKEILEYAKSHPEKEWAFIPHSGLEKQLKKAGMTEDEIHSYYREWENIAKCCYDNNYTDLFFNSELLITDNDAFLSEYYYTGKPIIHLISKDCKVEIPDILKPMHNTFYKVHNNEEMTEIFNSLILKKEDSKKEIRTIALEKTGMTNNYSSKNIADSLLKLLNK